MTEQELEEIEKRWQRNIEHNPDCVEADESRVDIPKLLDEVKRLREALQFYADEKSYEQIDVRPEHTDFPKTAWYCRTRNVVEDYGKRAREALGEEKK